MLSNKVATPKRTNEFQKLVYLIKTHLAASDEQVTESAMLVDRDSDRLTEVDVCIDGIVAGDPVKVSVECCDTKRPAGPFWLSGMMEKHRRLPTSVLVLASRNGFTKPALKIAGKNNVTCVSLDEVDRVDFPKLLGETSSLWTRSVTLTTERVRCHLVHPGSGAREIAQVTGEHTVFSKEGEEGCRIADVVAILIRAAQTRDHVLSTGEENHTWFEIRFVTSDLPNAIFLQKIATSSLWQIDTMTIVGRCEFKIVQFGLRAGRFGGVQLARGKTELFGETAMFVVTRDAAGVEKTTFLPKAGIG